MYFQEYSAVDVIDAANLTSCGVSNIARKLWTRVETLVRLLGPSPITTWDVRRYYQPGVTTVFWWCLTASNSDHAAVTFNSRARCRPICVVRTPITPDKTGIIYLPSTKDASTRPLLDVLPSRRQRGDA